MFSIIIPVFNEAENICNLIKEIDFNLVDYDNYEIIIVNDASIDDSLKKIREIILEKIKVINNNNNKGQSYSILKGIKHSSYDIIITLDGDGQNDPKDIPNLLRQYLFDDTIELIGGIRKKRKDSFIKILSSKTANYVRSRILNDNCEDTGCSLKVFNKEIFLNFPFFDGIHRFLPSLFRGYGYKTKFISVNHRKRKYGVSKYGTIKRLFKGILDMIKVYKILKKANKK